MSQQQSENANEPSWVITFLIASAAALGGFLFGFDTAVINGAVLALKSTFGAGDWEIGLSVSLALLGAAGGAFFAGMEQSVTNHDIRLGVIKSLVFAWLVVWICTGRGYFVQRIRGMGFGAESVSKVTTQAVVLASSAVLVFDYLLTAVLL